MRVLFLSFTVRTHLYHLAPLAWAFRSAGHEVRVAAQPGLTAAIVGAGLTAVEVGGGYDLVTDLVKVRSGASLKPGELGDLSPDDRRRVQATRFEPLIRLASVMAPDLLRFAGRWQPQLIVTDPLVFAAPLASATLGIPLVRHIWGPDFWRRMSSPMQGEPAEGDVREQWPTGLLGLYDEYGVVPRNDYVARTVDPWPGSLQLPGVPNRVAERFVPYNGSGATAVPDWILDDPGRPRVLVTWGTTAAMLDGGKTLLPEVVSALAALDVETVVAAGRAELDELGQLGGLPGNVRVAENVPLHLLTPTCAAIVNQGGAGSLLTAASHAVPQVLLPKTADTPANAAGFGPSGACVVLDVADADAELISSAVMVVLTDESIRAAARKVADEIASAPAPSDVVRSLAKLAWA